MDNPETQLTQRHKTWNEDKQKIQHIKLKSNMDHTPFSMLNINSQHVGHKTQNEDNNKMKGQHRKLKR